MTIQGSAAPKLSVRGATKVYGTAAGKLVAIDNCSLDVRPGEIVSVLGPSGCGKTTLLWSMSGLHALTAGTVLLDGKAIREPSREIGMVFQEATLFPWRNLEANIRFPFEIKGTKPDRAWIDELLHKVGLEGFRNRFPRELSGGMQQRAALVRALSFKPSVLLMDEPFGALDSFTREEMNRLVEEIWLETHTTIVLITHSIEEAIFLSDRVIVMSARPGRIANEYAVPFPRPRSLEIMSTHEVFDLTNAIKLEIVGEQKSRFAPAQAAAAIAAQ
jgi:NitT/TauT family transport system ATP-binding protein